MHDADTEALVAKKYRLLDHVLDERVRRLWAAAEADVLGYGGVSLVARATGLSRPTIAAGLEELQSAGKATTPTASGRIRRPGAGRPRVVTKDPELLAALESLVEPTARGCPLTPLRWTCKSVRILAAELGRLGHRVSHQTVSELLHEAGYSLQGNRKTLEGSNHPDRNAQFEFIAERTRQFQARGQPVVSVDTKKKELVGEYKNGGREWQPQGQPEKVKVHDFVDEELGRAIPYGVYDITQNAAWVSVGADHDTSAFAVQAIRLWWTGMGTDAYPDAKELFITADGGGSNGSRVRLWKVELQRLADETGLRISVSHFPPGTSKWNKIEHRLFCHITQNWRGRPLTSHRTIVNLIASTTTKAGLLVHAGLDQRSYPTGIPVTDKEMATLDLNREEFHGEWNYTLVPREGGRAGGAG